MAWLGLLVTIRWNWRQYRRGRPTICNVTRRVVPRWAFWPLYGAGVVALGRHVWNGYPFRP